MESSESGDDEPPGNSDEPPGNQGKPPDRESREEREKPNWEKTGITKKFGGFLTGLLQKLTDSFEDHNSGDNKYPKYILVEYKPVYKPL